MERTAPPTSSTPAVATLLLDANGAFAPGDTLSAGGSTCSISRSPALIKAALRALVVTPTPLRVALDPSVATGVGLAAAYASNAAMSTATRVVASLADTALPITHTRAAHASRDAQSDPASRASFARSAPSTMANSEVRSRETKITPAQSGARTAMKTHDPAHFSSNATGLSDTAVATGSRVYGAAVAHGTVPTFGSGLAYGADVNLLDLTPMPNSEVIP